MLPRPRAIFFDMDDTLLDSRSGSRDTWNQLCIEFAPLIGCEADALRAATLKAAADFWKDEAAVEKLWRTNLTAARALCARTAFEAEGWDLVHAEPLAQRYDEIMWDHLNIFDDAHEVLEGLRSKGFKLGMITNGPQWMQRKKIAKFDLEPYFDVIVIEGEFGHGKPHAAVFEHALKVTGSSPDEAWHIGDNQYADIGGAQKVGIHAVWIHRDRMELDAAHPVPDRAIGKLDELLAAIES